MSERDSSILSIRKEIPNINSDCRSDLESFQNKTLRPILKFQNELTLTILKSTKGFKEKDTNENLEQFNSRLKSFLSKNIKLKNQIVSTVTALFTKEEYAFYILHNKEVSKRIISMQLKRYEDELDDKEARTSSVS